MVTMADNGDMQRVCVVLKTHGVNVYPDTRNLLEYGFANFSKALPAANEKSEDVVEILAEKNIVVPNGVEFQDLDMEIVPDEEADKEGVLTYSFQGNPVGSVRAVLSQTYYEKQEAEKAQKQENVKGGEAKKEGLLEDKEIIKKCALGAAGVLLVGLVAILVKLILDGKRKKRKIKRNSQ